MSLMTRITGLSLVALVGLSTGCYSGPDSWGDGDEVEREYQINGDSENGFRYNSFRINGKSFNSGSFRINGTALENFDVVGSEFVGTMIHAGQPVELSGEDFLGAEIDMLADKLIDGEMVEVELTVRIDGMFPDPEEADKILHLVSQFNAESGDWEPLCTDEEGNETEAILLGGTWDSETGDRVDGESRATFACRGGVLAKCVDMGYAPWRTAKIKTGEETKEWVSLVDHHQACTRMLRADYCGTGEPNTINGTIIDVGDRVKRYKVDGQKFKGNIEAYASDWTYEAEWGPDGAVCVGDSLRTQLFEGMDDYEMPSCIDDIPQPKKCGKLKKTWQSGALLGTRFEPSN